MVTTNNTTSVPCNLTQKVWEPKWLPSFNLTGAIFSIRELWLPCSHAPVLPCSRAPVFSYSLFYYDILSAELQAAKNLHIPSKIRKFNRRKHKKEKWMTNDLLLPIVLKNKKHVEWKSTLITHDNYEQIKHNFKIYEKDTVNNIREAKNIILIEFLRHINLTRKMVNMVNN